MAMDPANTDGAPLNGIGYWRDEKGNWPHPSDYVDSEWEPLRRTKIVRYLRSGAILSAYLGFSFCRFKCGISNSTMGNREMTDGKWVWPEGLAHYVESHLVRLPAEFLNTMVEHNFTIPIGLDVEQLLEQPCSTEFWMAWCNMK